MKLLARLLSLVLVFAAAPVRAETGEVRISKGFGILYLPLIVMQDQKLLEKKAAEAGLGEVKVTWLVIDGGNSQRGEARQLGERQHPHSPPHARS